MAVSRKVSLDVSSGCSDNDTFLPPTRSPAYARPGRYLVRSGSVYIFQMRMPQDIVGPRIRILRIGLGPLTAREARVKAEELAVHARNWFDQRRKADMTKDSQFEAGALSLEEDECNALIALGEVKGYLKAMHTVLTNSPDPVTPPHQEAAFAGLRGLVELNRELAKGANASVLIADNAEFLKERSIARIDLSLKMQREVEGSPSGSQPVAVAAMPVKTISPPPVLNNAGLNARAQIPSSNRKLQSFQVPIHRDAAGKIIPAFRLDRRTVERQPSGLPL